MSVGPVSSQRAVRRVPPHAASIAESAVDHISERLGEPSWMREFRRRSLGAFCARPLPTWGGDVSEVDFATESYVPFPHARSVMTPPELAALGVAVTDLGTALRDYEPIVREHLGTVVPPDDNLFAALNGAVWAGGWFVHVPPGVVVPVPVTLPRGTRPAPAGSFDRALVIVGEGASVELVGIAEGEAGGPLRAGVLELVAKQGARVTHSLLQRWPSEVFDLTTHRAAVDAGASVSWMEVTVGGRVTMRYPSAYLRGEGAAGHVVSVAVAGPGQHQDVGGKLVCSAPRVTGRITSYAIAGGGAGARATFRGLVKVAAGAAGASCDVRDESLRLDAASRVDAHPYVEVDEPGVRVSQERGSTLFDDAKVRAFLGPGVGRAEAVVRAGLDFVAPALPLLSREQRTAIESALRRIGAAERRGAAR